MRSTLEKQPGYENSSVETLSAQAELKNDPSSICRPLDLFASSPMSVERFAKCWEGSDGMTALLKKLRQMEGI